MLPPGPHPLRPREGALSSPGSQARACSWLPGLSILPGGALALLLPSAFFLSSLPEMGWAVLSSSLALCPAPSGTALPPSWGRSSISATCAPCLPLCTLPFDLGLLCSAFLQGSGSVNGSPLLSTSGASTPGRGGRRQLPQTPLTPRPSITYKTANSSPVHFAGAQTSLPAFSPDRLSRGLSEHNALLQRDPLSQPLAPSSRIGSDPYLGQRLDSEAAARTQLEDTLTFEEAVATNSGRSSRTSYVSSLTSQSHPLRRVPNGYHCTLGLSSGGGGRGRPSYHRPDQDHWC